MTDYQQLQERLKTLAGPVDHETAWDQIGQRATRTRSIISHWDRTTSRLAAFRRDSLSLEEAAVPARVEERPGVVRQASAPRSRSGLRVAAFASIAVVLLAALAVGSFMAVRNLAQPDFVLAITDDNVVSTGAQSGRWERLPVPLAKGETIHTISVYALVVNPRDPSILYVGTDDGFFKSTDGAGSWNLLSTIPKDPWVFTLDPTFPSTVYVAYTGSAETDSAATTHLLRSDDSGVTWTDLNEAGAPRIAKDTIYGIWFDTATNPSTIYMYDDTAQVCRSTDRGTTWTRLSFSEGQQALAFFGTPRSAPPIPAAAQHVLDSFLASFGEKDVYLTDAETGAELGPIDPRTILVDPDHVSTFYAATGAGVYKSIDSGRTWRKASTGLPDVTDPADAAVNSVLVDPNTPSTLFATTKTGIYRSTNGGAAWTLILKNSSSPDADRGSVVLAPSRPSRLYALTDAGLFRSDDGGTNWTQLNGAGVLGKERTGPFGRLTLVLADQPDTLFAVSEDAVRSPLYLYRSTDAGSSWQRTDVEVSDGAGGFNFSRGVVADPQHASTIYALIGSAPNNGGLVHHVAKSTDAGATWIDLAPAEWDAPVVDLSVDPHNPSIVWAIQNGLAEGEHSIARRSTDGGATWEKVKLEGTADRISSIVFDPRSANTLYAYTGGTSYWDGTLHRSTDGGATWENIGADVPYWFETASLVPDPAPGGALYAATSGGLFKWVPGQ